MQNRVRRMAIPVATLAVMCVLAAGSARPASAAVGDVLTDSGFRPDTNGFAFENYGPAPDSELTPPDMRAIFGSAVCVDAAAPVCDLKPPATTWMETENKGASEGHCSGFSVTSLLFFKDDITPTDFGAARVPAITLPRNVAIQRRIAQSAVFQTFYSVNRAKFEGTPNQVLDKLIASLKPGERETYTIAIVKANGKGGHAVTPYSVVDRGNNRFGVLIYENNEPGVVNKEIVFDRTADTWTYDARTNPSQRVDTYAGTAQSNTIYLLPTTPGIGVQPCPFCNPAPAASQARALRAARAAGAAPAELQVTLEGNVRNHAHVLISDASGGRIGYRDGQLVRRLRGARADIALADDTRDRLEPQYIVPAGRNYTIATHGSQIRGHDATDIALIGPGFDARVLADLRRIDRSQLTLSADGRQLTMRSNSIVSPTLKLGRVEGGTDHAFTVKATPVRPGTTLTLRAGPNRFTIKSRGRGGHSVYSVSFTRSNATGDIFFVHRNLVLPPNVTVQVMFRAFTSKHMAVPVKIIYRNGRVKTRMLADQR